MASVRLIIADVWPATGVNPDGAQHVEIRGRVSALVRVATIGDPSRVA